MESERSIKCVAKRKRNASPRMTRCKKEKVALFSIPRFLAAIGGWMLIFGAIFVGLRFTPPRLSYDERVSSKNTYQNGSLGCRTRRIPIFQYAMARRARAEWCLIRASRDSARLQRTSSSHNCHTAVMRTKFREQWNHDGPIIPLQQQHHLLSAALSSTTIIHHRLSSTTTKVHRLRRTHVGRGDHAAAAAAARTKRRSALLIANENLGRY
jgi:hypothetical protein